MTRWIERAVLSLAAFVLMSQATAAPPTHDVYIWQRHWTPALRTALVEGRDTFAGVRVLVAQAGRDGRWFAADVSPDDFAGDDRPRVAVVRYDGVGSAPEPAMLDVFLFGLIARWRDAGRPFAGVEIDYDCATRRLADYAQRLALLRRDLPVDIALSATALPSWTDGTALDDVTGAVDETVLQLHAVTNPRKGLFDARRAESWTRAYARHTTRPFRVALPAYGTRVRFDEAGAPVAVENEMTVDAAASADAREFVVEPADVAALLRALEADPPPHWSGVAWFRLPTADDRRAWTLAAMRSVIAGRVPDARLSPLALLRGNGVSDVFQINDGDADANARALRVVGATCASGDATEGFRLERERDGWRFVPSGDVRVRAGARRAVGWVRCEGIAEVEFE